MGARGTRERTGRRDDAHRPDQMTMSTPSRREFLAMLGAAALVQPSPTPALPLQNLGLEHLDIVVPDPAASAKFYMRVFKTSLHQQPISHTFRYYLIVDDPA